MKDSTNFTFILKILALLCLLIVGLTKNEVLPTTELENQDFSINDPELSSYIYLTPETETTKQKITLASITKKK